MRRIHALAAALPLWLAPAGAAFAHAHLKTAEPAVDSTVTTAPSEVAIVYSEGVEPRFSTIEVQDAGGKRVDKADPHTAPNDNKRLLVSLAPLATGIYTVVWHATAVDTHKTEGTFHFTVGAQSAMAVEKIWARATPPGAQTAAAYLTITDHGPADHLVSITTPIAGMTELHETTNDGGVMKMRPVGQLALATGTPVTFAPGGYHIMMMDLKQPLKAGDTFPITLTFEHATPITVQASVAPLGASAPMGHDHMTMGGASK